MTDDFCIFDLAEMVWRNPDAVGGRRPSARFQMGFAAAGTSIFLFGGYGRDSRFLNDLHALDTSKLNWEAKHQVSTPAARAAMGFAAAGNMLYLFGGVDMTGNTTNDLHMLDPATMVWEELSERVSGSAPSKRAFMGFTAVGNRIFLFGGRETVHGPSVNSLHSLDVASLFWEDLTDSFQGPRLPELSFMGLAAMEDALYVIGGLADGAHLRNDMYILDLNTRTLTERSVGVHAPPGRHSFGLTAAGGQAFMFGGNVQSEYYVNELLRFDPTMNMWEDLSNSTSGTPPSPRYLMGVACFEQSLFVFGGGTDGSTSGYVNDLYVLDLSSLAWEELTFNVSTAPLPRTGMSFAAVRGRLFVFGGNRAVWRSDLIFGDFFMFDLSTMTWHALEGKVSGSQPTPRAYASFTASEDGKLYLFGGRGRSRGKFNDVFVFDPEEMAWSDLSGAIEGIAPNPRQGHASAVGMGMLFVLGGEGPTRFNDFFALDLTSRPMRWHDLTAATQSSGLLPAVSGAGLVYLEHSLYHFGGWGQTDEGDWQSYGTWWEWRASNTIHANWTRTTLLSDLAACYDWDHLVVQGFIDKRLELCSGFLPCELSLSSAEGGAIFEAAGQVSCSGVGGCFGVSLTSAVITCAAYRQAETMKVSAGARVRVSHSTVAACTSASGGTFLTVSEGAAAEVTHTVFRELKSLGAGGAVLVSDSSLEVSSSEFRGCVSGRGGGAVATTGASSLVLEQSRFDGCASELEGGCVLSLATETTIQACVFQGARSQTAGGAVSALGNLHVGNSTFTGCSSASGTGGAVHARGLADALVPVEADVIVVASHFINCSASHGGAVAVQGGRGDFTSSTFLSNRVPGHGGAIATEQATVTATSCLFSRNAASLNGGALSIQGGSLSLHGVTLSRNEAARGGGGVYALNAEAGLKQVTAATNAATQGGGGVMLWEGLVPPVIEALDCTSCDEDGDNQACNSALYGACLASDFAPPLHVRGPPQIAAGLPFEVVVTKRDYYNQTIRSDSASILEVVASLASGDDVDPSVRVSGSPLRQLRRGVATFQIALHPSFSAWSASNASTSLVREPLVTFVSASGDGAVGRSIALASAQLRLPTASGDAVCPAGAVLDLRPNEFGFEGTCTPCLAGTYSLSPLTGTLTHPLFPACLPCPRDLHCRGGVHVQPPAVDSEWEIVDGRWTLRACSTGHAPAWSGAEQLCEPCGIGHECTEAKCVKCQQCRPGTYKDVRGPQLCTPCPRDTFSPAVGAASASDCRRCPEGAHTHGRVAQANVSECTCQDGFYTVLLMEEPRLRCMPCPATAVCSDGRDPVFASESVTVWGSFELALSEALSQAELQLLIAEALGVGTDSIQISPRIQLDSGPAARRDSDETIVKVDFTVAGPRDLLALDLMELSFLSAAIGQAAAAWNATLVRNLTASESGQPGETWERDPGGVYRLLACPRGSLLVNFSIADQRCDKCLATTYSVSPLEGCEGGVCNPRACNPCPAGAVCAGGDSFEPLVADSTWDDDQDALSRTVKRLSRCGHGHVLVRHDWHAQRDQCVACPAGTYRLSEALWTSRSGVVETAELAPGKCLPCENGAECPGGNRIEAKENRWVLPSDVESAGASQGGRARVYQCANERCKAGNECHEGFAGPVCGLCKRGYSNSGPGCQKCNEAATVAQVRFQAAAVTLPFFLVVWYFVSWRPLWPEKRGAHAGCLSIFRSSMLWMATRVRLGMIHHAKILVSFWQVVSTFDSSFQLQWPRSLTSLWSIGGILNLDAQRLAPGCLYEGMGFLFRLRFYSILVVAVGGLFALPCLLLLVAGRRHTGAFDRVSSSLWRGVLLWLFFVFPFVSVISVQGWRCRSIGGQTLLDADLTQPCPRLNPRSEAFIGTVLATAAFPLGIVGLMVWVLFSFRVPHLARERRERALREAMLQQLRGGLGKKLTTRIALLVCGMEEGVVTGAGHMFAEASHGRRLLSPGQFVAYTASVGVQGEDEEELREIMAAFDADEDGQLECEEFVAMVECIVREIGRFLSIDDMLECPEHFVAIFDSWQGQEASDDAHGHPASVSVLRSILAKRTTCDGANIPGGATDVERGFDCRSTGQADACETASSRELLSKGKRLLGDGALMHPVVWTTGELTPAEEAVLDRVGDLFRGYKVELWFFELVEMARKFTMTTLIVFIFDGVHRIAAALAIQCAFLVLHVRCQPFASPSLNRFQTVSLLGQAVTVFYGHVIVVDSLYDDLEVSLARPNLEALAVAMHYLVTLALPMSLAFEACRTWWLKRRCSSDSAPSASSTTFSNRTPKAAQTTPRREPRSSNGSTADASDPPSQRASGEHDVIPSVGNGFCSETRRHSSPRLAASQAVSLSEIAASTIQQTSSRECVVVSASAAASRFVEDKGDKEVATHTTELVRMQTAANEACVELAPLPMTTRQVLPPYLEASCTTATDLTTPRSPRTWEPSGML